ncbi:hypothetical protein ANN_00861 [Periplaneta americana]|uniref:Transposase n=1 Tax=Periplaneta americana TaxID=6978 RepID=A0ABQ8TUV0_PERAM|nr:hypothetical protein ANN_00861 [Periplaneta americana]
MTHFSYKRDETSSINLQQLYRLFDTEKRNIINVLQYLKLLSQSYRCPVCNQDMKLVERTQLKDRYEWQCTKNNDRDILEHHVVRSLREGTWFSQSELTLEQVTLLTYFWVKELPLKFVLEETRISSGTVGDYFIYCREFCDIILTQKENKIGGEKHIIEIEESPFPKREYHGDKRIYKKWVYGGVDRETGECFLHPVENKSAAAL